MKSLPFPHLLLIQQMMCGLRTESRDLPGPEPTCGAYVTECVAGTGQREPQCPGSINHRVMGSHRLCHTPFPG